MQAADSAVPSPSYLEFELEIGSSRGKEFPVSVIRSPAGEARGKMRLPVGRGRLKDPILGFERELFRSGRRRSPASSGQQIAPPSKQSVREFGEKLFHALIRGDVLSCFRESLNRARDQGKDLRVRLRIQSPDLAALPWEFLYDPSEGEYVCLLRRTSIVRYLELRNPDEPLSVTPPLRILGMIANPRDPDLGALEVGEEQRRIEEATRPLREQGLLKLEWVEGQTWRDLQSAMDRGPWHIFHFIGHGEFDPDACVGGIVLSDEVGGRHDLGATELARLVDEHHSLRLVVLNSCRGGRGGEGDLFSSVAATLVRRGIPAVVAMQYDITDGAAIEFSRKFYEGLAQGFPIDAAVARGRKAVTFAIADSMEFATPVLYTHTMDGVLFRLDPGARPSQPIAQPGPSTPPEVSMGPAPVLPTRSVTAPAPVTTQAAPVRPEPPRADQSSTVAEARQAMSRSDWNRAIPLWEELLRAGREVGAETAEAYFSRSQRFIARGDYRRAVEDLSRAINLAPGRSDCFTRRGESYLKIGEDQRAIADFSRALELEPGNVGCYELRGKAYHAVKEYDLALADFNRASTLAPQNAHRYRFYAGASRVCKGDFVGAIAEYSCAIQGHPREAAYYVERGRSYRWSNSAGEGKRDYERAVALDPDKADRYFDELLPVLLA